MTAPLFFGCFDRGHWLYEPDSRQWLSRTRVRELGLDLALLDTGYCPADRAPARARFILIDGPHGPLGRPRRAVLSMWDYSGDRRPGSHATFVFLEADGLDAEHALFQVRTTWPDVVERIEAKHGPITLIDGGA